MRRQDGEDVANVSEVYVHVANHPGVSVRTSAHRVANGGVVQPGVGEPIVRAGDNGGVVVDAEPRRRMWGWRRWRWRWRWRWV